jgi:hypothetical protein
LLDEFAIAAYWTGNYREARLAGGQLLNDKKFPEDQRERIEANLKFSTDALLSEGG